ncbi:MAG: V-type ATPase subunit [Spirochaetota bacterium]
MPTSFQPEYIHARVCGAVARSRLGSKAASLVRLGRVAEVWKTLFDEAAPALPERLLVAAAERKLEVEAIRDFMSLAGPVSKHDDFFRALLRKVEFGYAKKLLVAFGEGATVLPDGASFPVRSSLRSSFFPDRGRVFSHRRFAWLAEGEHRDLTMAKNRLDRQYYTELWKVAADLPSSLKGSLPRVLRKEAELENIVWALRLRRYYGMRPDEIQPLLVDFRGVDAGRSAMEALGKRPDTKADWTGWEWEGLINESGRAGEEWHLDVRHVEIQAKKRIFADLIRAMHMELESYVPLYAYFRIKEYETAAIFGVLEGIHLEAPVDEIADFAAELTAAYA